MISIDFISVDATNRALCLRFEIDFQSYFPVNLAVDPNIVNCCFSNGRSH